MRPAITLAVAEAVGAIADEEYAEGENCIEVVDDDDDAEAAAGSGAKRLGGAAPVGEGSWLYPMTEKAPLLRDDDEAAAEEEE